MCDFLKRRKKDVSFRLQYPWGQEQEKVEARSRLEKINTQLKEELNLLRLRGAAADRHWDPAPAMDVAMVKKLDQCIWSWSKKPHPAEKRTDDEDGLDWSYYENVYPKGSEEFDNFYGLDKWHAPSETKKGGYIQLLMKIQVTLQDPRTTYVYIDVLGTLNLHLQTSIDPSR